MDKFLEALAALIFLTLSFWIKDKIDARKRKRAQVVEKEKHSIEFTSLVHEKVKNAENEIMKVWRPVRMFIFHFYNGDVTEAGLPLLKIAIRHEIALYPGVKFITEHYQGRPVPEMFYEGIKETFKKGHFVFTLESCETNPPLKDFFDTWDVSSMLWIAVRNVTGKPAAVLVLQWPGEKPPVDYRDILKIKAEKLTIEKIYAAIHSKDDKADD